MLLQLLGALLVLVVTLAIIYVVVNLFPNTLARVVGSLAYFGTGYLLNNVNVQFFPHANPNGIKDGVFILFIFFIITSFAAFGYSLNGAKKDYDSLSENFRRMIEGVHEFIR